MRTTSAVEGTFASVRLLKIATKRLKQIDNATALIWRQPIIAEIRCRCSNALRQRGDVHEEREFGVGEIFGSGWRPLVNTANRGVDLDVVLESCQGLGSGLRMTISLSREPRRLRLHVLSSSWLGALLPQASRSHHPKGKASSEALRT